MKKLKVFYWIFTVLFAVEMLFASIPDILNTSDAVKFMSDHLGYPHYFTPFIGVLKFLGVIAILIFQKKFFKKAPEEQHTTVETNSAVDDKVQVS